MRTHHIAEPCVGHWENRENTLPPTPRGSKDTDGEELTTTQRTSVGGPGVGDSPPEPLSSEGDGAMGGVCLEER